MQISTHIYVNFMTTHKHIYLYIYICVCAYR